MSSGAFQGEGEIEGRIEEDEGMKTGNLPSFTFTFLFVSLSLNVFSSISFLVCCLSLPFYRDRALDQGKELRVHDVIQ